MECKPTGRLLITHCLPHLLLILLRSFVKKITLDKITCRCRRNLYFSQHKHLATDWIFLHQSQLDLLQRTKSVKLNIGIIPFQAISYMQQDLGVAKSLGDVGGECRAHGNLGSAYFSQANYKDALTSHRYQLVLAMKCKDTQAAASALTSLGKLSFNC
jgi:hypothetical protein